MSDLKYEPNIIEPKWQRFWEENKVYSPDLDTAKKPYYNLMMFPYSSAEGLHIGNMYAFTGADIYGRFKRMSGNDVFEPMGLDGFGIHSENYALKIGKHPMDQAKVSEKNFYKQLHSLGNSYDWTRTVETYDPEYYKWTQWIFVKMFKNGLAYRKKATVNYCPSCKTVLADEQVIKQFKVQSSKFKVQLEGEGPEVEEQVENVCERCSTPVEKRELEQWFFKITDYAEKLLDGLSRIDWTEKVKIAQRNWIGRSEGARIEFKVQSAKFKIEVFTTRPDTLFGATFLVLAPENELVTEMLNGKWKMENGKLDEIRKYMEEAKKKSETDRINEGWNKTGVFSGLTAVNPATNEEIPIYIADYVLTGYGTGAIMGVPAHDQRDFEFARKMGLDIREVVVAKDDVILTKFRDKVFEPRELLEAYEGVGTVVNSGEFSWKSSEVVKKKIVKWLQEKGAGGEDVHYHLRDWLISRQRYWGPPIPMIYCSSCAEAGRSWFTIEYDKQNPNNQNSSRYARTINYSSSPMLHRTRSLENSNLFRNSDFDIRDSSHMAGWYPVPEDQLPVELPYIEDFKPMGTGVSPLANHPEFYKVACPECGSDARRETDVSDTFLDSSWYFLRYLATDLESVPFPVSESRIKNHELRREKSHDSLFMIHNSSQRLRWLPVDIYIGGAEHSVLHLLYVRFMTMFFHDLGLIDFDEPFTRFFAHGLIIKEGAKMSKSKGNVVVPDEYISKYGADTVRAYLMFLGPFSQGGDFRDTGIEGMNRFVKRVWKLFTQDQRSKIKDQKLNGESLYFMHKTIKKVTEDIERFSYNTAISALMEWHNYLSAKIKDQRSKISEEEVVTFLKLLAPFMPHLTEEIYQSLESRIMNQESRTKKKNHDSVFSIQYSSFKSINIQPWPIYDEKYLQEENVTIVIQVNGKKRGEMQVQSATHSTSSGQAFKVQSEIEKMAREKVKNYLEGKEVEKVIYVPGKIINFVV